MTTATKKKTKKRAKARARSSVVDSFEDTKGRRRWSIFLGPEDHMAIDVIRRIHGHDKASEAVRFAIRQQAARDQAPPNGSKRKRS